MHLQITLSLFPASVYKTSQIIKPMNLFNFILLLLIFFIYTVPSKETFLTVYISKINIKSFTYIWHGFSNIYLEKSPDPAGRHHTLLLTVIK